MKNQIHSTQGIQHRTALGAASVAVFLLSACAHPRPTATPAPVRPADAVASVNGVPIERTQVEAWLKTSGQPDTPTQRAATERGLIARELIRQAAEAEKLGDAPETRAAVEKARVDTENRLYIARHMNASAVTDQQVHARYDAIVSSLGPVSYKPRVIVVPNEHVARSALAMLARGASFESVASRDSFAPSKADGGALPWVSLKTPVVTGQTQGLPDDVARALVKLNPGEYTRTPIAVGDTRVLVKLDAKRATAIPTYEQVRGELSRSMTDRAREDAFNALVDALAKKASIVR
ncbi:peptidyl-prolyl cis-trans isomerase [Burkholderia pyrrocinia]|uniref:peptidyl-prolyl cis-trans isomerase n=1 Tax=Burkholderia pyrrocinia TaxID=60550 RepID=UPI001BD07B71|nr:peptidyl-prolyl cis-trans isomerase [Burkholderia pyrrocinia]QVN21297.1 peptidyl-prolyl cis-trans isomerase [Burkholderia pyrrocinia]